MTCLQCNSESIKFIGGCMFGCHMQYLCSDCNEVSFFRDERNITCPDWIEKVYMKEENKKWQLE